MSDEPRSLAATVGRLTDRLLATLPPAFILLVALNVIFLGLVMRFLDHQTENRTALLGRIIDACMQAETVHK